MRLTLHSDYALRTLMYLALRPERLASIAEIAGAYRISEAHMVKVVHRLGQAGFVDTLRGRGGGIRLGRPAAEIRLGDVVRFTEEDLALVVCFGTDGRSGDDTKGERCVIAGACKLQSTLGKALAAFLAVLDDVTVADLVVGRVHGAMLERLGLPADLVPPSDSTSAKAKTSGSVPAEAGAVTTKE